MNLIEDIKKKIKELQGEFDKFLEKVPKSMFPFYLATLIRIVVPIFLFHKMNPFWAILINEFVLDFLMSPHHLVREIMPEDKKCWANHYYSDKPLDTWGFLMALQPVVLPSNKFYHIFDGYRDLIFYLFIYRFIGFIIFCKTKVRQVFVIFANFYFTTYLVVAFFKTYLRSASKETINTFIILGFIYTAYKEYTLHGKDIFATKYDKEFVL